VPSLTYRPVGFQLEELKARDDGWSFSGYASTFGNVDEGGDVVLRGAFRDTLKVRPNPRLLWQHDIGEPIGKVVSLREDQRGLFGEFKLSRTARGQDAYVLLKDGALDSMSIGYIPDDQAFSDDGVRQLKSVSLREISVVSMPMNEEALITAVKAASQRNPLVVDHLQELFRQELPSNPDVPVAAASSESPSPTSLATGAPSILTMKVALYRKQLERIGVQF
jgi:uncharacterized protein